MDDFKPAQVTTRGRGFGQETLQTDIVIIGGGFAGSLLALVLARQGHAPVVVDLYHPYPSDFRCEKFSADQVERLRALGVLDCFQSEDLFGADPRHLTMKGLRYDQMVKALRAAWPGSVRFVTSKVQAIRNDRFQQTLKLADGTAIDSRVAVLATGPGEKLRVNLGLHRDVLSKDHSICIGFSLLPQDGDFAFEGLIHRGEKAGDGVGYASLFRIGDVMRVNLFLYDDPKSARVQALRHDPVAALFQIMPGLRAKLGAVRLSGSVDMRVTDLYAVDAAKAEGVVLIGDARRTSCPASGTGITRILNDVKLLRDNHMASWLKGDGVSAQVFYAQPAVQQLDADMHRRSHNGRQLAVNTALPWRLRRALHSLRAALKPVKIAPSVIAPPTGPQFFIGDTVVVRSAQDILATLDSQGRHDGTLFMPEMVALIGQTHKVHRRADRTCVEGHGLRKMESTVFLEQARCDGGAHDGCQRDCLFFWKEAWLKPADEAGPVLDTAAERKARKALLALTTRTEAGYVCQSTQLATASLPLSKTHAKELMQEIRHRELTVAGFFGIMVRAVINKVRRAVKMPEMGLIVGEPGKKSKGTLDLKPGDWVRIKSAEEIKATLTPNAKNLGLSFEPEMALLMGQVRQVEAVLDRMIHEETGQMIGLTRTVTLKSTYCQGLCSKNCPRANPLFWRESWLERVDAAV